MHRLNIFIYYFLVFLFSIPNGIAQNQQDNYIFEELPSEMGFDNIGFQDILEDHQGFLWMATWFGLVKFDGYRMKIYRQQRNNPNGLQSNIITDILEDSQQILWVGTAHSGLYKYHSNIDKFEQFVHDPANKNSLSNDNIRGIAEDKDGSFWVATKNGLNKYVPANNQFTRYYHNPDSLNSLPQNQVNTVTKTQDGSIWIGTEQGVSRLIKNGLNESFQTYDLRLGQQSDIYEKDHNYVRKIVPSRYDPNVLWICTGLGLKRLTYSTEDLNLVNLEYWGYQEGDSNSLSHPFVSIAYEESKDQIWIATHGGLNLLNHRTGKNIAFVTNENDPSSISSNTVSGLGKDKSNNLWIGLGRRINKLNLSPERVQGMKLNGPNKNTITSCLLNSSKGEGVWAGSFGGGLNYLAKEEISADSFILKNYSLSAIVPSPYATFITDLTIDDKDDYLWIATDGAGVIRVRESILLSDGTLKDLTHFSVDNQLPHDYIQSLEHSITGDTWVGFWSYGIGRFEKKTNTFHHYTKFENADLDLKEFPAIHLLEIVENGQPYLWVGTRGNGIYKARLDEQNHLHLVQHYISQNKDFEGLSNNFIECFFLDKQRRLWIGTYDGLSVLDVDANQYLRFQEKILFEDKSIMSILESEAGHFWITTQDGLSKLTISDSVLVRDLVFDRQQSFYFMDAAATISKQGNFLFGGTHGISIFKEEDMRYDSLAPKIVLTDFKIFHQSVPIGEMEDGRTILSKNITHTDEIELNYKDNVISFEFTGLHFKDPQKNQYAYQLEGINPDWVYTDAKQRIAQYNNLPYDTFVFKVKAANRDGVWSEPIALKLIVLPPLWQTGWAYFLYTLLGIGFIYLVFRLIQIRAAYRHRIALEQLEKKKLQEINKVKLQFFTNISHELRTPLTLIVSLLEQLLTKGSYKKDHQLLTLMHQNAKRLMIMINQLLDIRQKEEGLMVPNFSIGNIVTFIKEITDSFQIFAKQNNISLGFSSTSESMLTWFDPTQLDKVIYNLLTNAFKFTSMGGQILVHLEQKEHIQITVSDTGIGIPANQLDEIFQRFFQVKDPLHENDNNGVGIGLSLVKDIVDQHKGSISVQSDEGKGTTFYIQLPLEEAYYSEKESTTTAETLPSFVEEKKDLPEPKEMVSPLVLQKSPSTESHSELSILIAEDNFDIRAFLSEHLSDRFYIIEAANGKEGLDKAMATLPNLIIADIAMPIMNGIELCANIKSNLETSHIPVILLTARTSLAYKITGLEKGADYYITKPFNMQLLKVRINNLLASRKKMQERFTQKIDFNPSEIAINSLDEELLTKVKEIIEQRMGESSFTVEKLAKELYMTRLQLYRKLKALTGLPPKSIIKKMRLERSVQLIKSKQYSISTITYMVGYKDLKSFRTQFKKEYEVSPSEYQKNHAE